MSAGAGTRSVAPPAIDQELRRRIAEQLGARFKGDLIGPDDAEYGRARLVWNAMIDWLNFAMSWDDPALGPVPFLAG